MLGEKNGSSLQSIRKYMQQHFNMRRAQTASFNSLSLKAAVAAVGAGVLERIGKVIACVHVCMFDVDSVICMYISFKHL